MDSKLAHAIEEYNIYCNSLKYENRFFVNDKFNKIFEIYIQENYEILNEEMVFYRARINNTMNKRDLYDEENIRMPRKGTISSSGRANPKGINYFYVATNISTCINEVKPNIESGLTIGVFKSKKKLKILKIENLATLSDEIVIREFGTQDKADLESMKDLIMNFMLIFMIYFSNFIGENHDIEYLPHQYFVEFCKQRGFDGIQYSSSVSKEDDNLNFVFYEDTHFDLIEKKLILIKNINYEY